MKEKPFIYLKDNVDKLDMDDELKPLFIECMDLIEDYFEKHDLLDCYDFKTFFDKYLINDSDEKIKFIVRERNNDTYGGFHSYYMKNEYYLKMNRDELNPHKFCHEFIHLLVHKVPGLSDEKDDKNIGETFLDEGATERLARDITNYVLPYNCNTYNENVEFSKFLEAVEGEKEFYKLLFSGKSLSNHFFNKDKTSCLYLKILPMLKNFEGVEYFYSINKNLNKDNTENLYREFEIYLIDYILVNTDFKVNNINDLINIAKKIGNRPLEGNPTAWLYYKLSEKFIDDLGEKNPNSNGYSDLTKLDIKEMLVPILKSYDTIYLYGPSNYARVVLENDLDDETQTVYIDEKFEPIKSNYDAHSCYIGISMNENSNDDNRKRYYTKNFKKSDIDFEKEKKSDIRIINSTFKRFFEYNIEYSNIIINQLLNDYCNTKLELINNENMNEILKRLEQKIDPILYQVISEKISEFVDNKNITKE